MNKTGIGPGAIGVFDILGYTSLLKNNKPETVADTVIPVLENLPKIVRKCLRLKNPSDPLEKYLLTSIKWLVFSDTIVLYTCDSSLPSSCCLWAPFIAESVVLMRLLFDNGLPVRGGIDFGAFVVKGNFLAGKPFVGAHEIGSQLELAGCVFTAQAREAFEKAKDADANLERKEAESVSIMRDFLEKSVLEYPVPTKSVNAVPPATLNFLSLPGPDFKDLTGDIRQFVYSAFWAHKKQMSARVEKKADNTERYIRFVLDRYPDLREFKDADGVGIN